MAPYLGEPQKRIFKRAAPTTVAPYLGETQKRIFKRAAPTTVAPHLGETQKRIFKRAAPTTVAPTNCCTNITLSSGGSLCQEREKTCGTYEWIETNKTTGYPIYYKEPYYIAFQNDLQVQLSPGQYSTNTIDANRLNSYYS